MKLKMGRSERESNKVAFSPCQTDLGIFAKNLIQRDGIDTSCAMIPEWLEGKTSVFAFQAAALFYIGPICCDGIAQIAHIYHINFIGSRYRVGRVGKGNLGG